MSTPQHYEEPDWLSEAFAEASATVEQPPDYPDEPEGFWESAPPEEADFGDLDAILGQLESMSDEPSPDFAPDYETMVSELAEMGIEVGHEPDDTELQKFLENYHLFNEESALEQQLGPEGAARYMADPETFLKLELEQEDPVKPADHVPAQVRLDGSLIPEPVDEAYVPPQYDLEDLERAALEQQWRRDNVEFQNRLDSDPAYRELIANRRAGLTDETPVRLPDPQAARDIQHVHMAFAEGSHEVSLIPVEQVPGEPVQAIGIIDLPAETAMVERANRHLLYDARFMGTEHVEDGKAISTVQAVEIYRDTNGEFSGRVLDIGHFESRDQAEEQYFTMQGTLDGGELSPHSVSYVAEIVAEHNGLNPAAWRDVTEQDVDLYKHLVMVDLGEAERDLPPEGWHSPLMLTASPGPDDIEQMVADLREMGIELERDTDENAQAIAALQAAGLEPLKDFNLHACSYLDEKTGIRFIAGIFQSDPDNASSGCQGAFVALSPSTPGVGMEAEVVPFGGVGSFEQARNTWELVQYSLAKEGPTAAFTTMDEIEKSLEVQQEQPAPTAPSFEMEL